MIFTMCVCVCVCVCVLSVLGVSFLYLVGYGSVGFMFDLGWLVVKLTKTETKCERM